MPVITDATLITSPDFNTASANQNLGGRKQIVLQDGTLVAVYRQSVGNAGWEIKSSTDGSTWSLIKSTLGLSSIADVSIVPIGNDVGIVWSQANSILFARYKKDGTQIGANKDLAAGTGYAVNGGAIDVSIEISDDGKELHVAFTNINNQTPNSINIGYVKGTIKDNMIVWNNFVPVTTENTIGRHIQYPRIVILPNGHVGIFVMAQISTSDIRVMMYTNNSTFRVSGPQSTDQYWGVYQVYGGVSGTSYAQAVDDVMYVPASINGLQFGRIWVTFHGRDNVETTYDNVFVAYSDNLGVSWTVTRITNSTTTATNKRYPSITANHKNRIFLVYQDGNTGCVALVNDAGTWSAHTALVSGQRWPHLLFDRLFNFKFNNPLYIFLNANSTLHIGFKGSWTKNSISVAPGSIGTKTGANKSNLLTYSITSDAAMTAITEAVNGVIVATKNIASGESTAVNLSAEQWDAIKYGKYNAVEQLLSQLPVDWEQGMHAGSAVGTAVTTVASSLTVRYKTPIVVEPNTEYIFKATNTKKELIASSIMEADSSGLRTVATLSALPGTKFRTAANTTRIYINLTLNPSMSIVPADVIVFAPELSKVRLNNEITITMGDDTWTYRFSKIPAAGDSLVGTAKAAQDTNSTFLPSIKAKIGAAIRSRNGSVRNDASWDTMLSALKAAPAVSGSNVNLGAMQSAQLIYLDQLEFNDELDELCITLSHDTSPQYFLRAYVGMTQIFSMPLSGQMYGLVRMGDYIWFNSSTTLYKYKLNGNANPTQVWSKVFNTASSGAKNIILADGSCVSGSNNSTVIEITSASGAFVKTINTGTSIWANGLMCADPSDPNMIYVWLSNSSISKINVSTGTTVWNTSHGSGVSMELILYKSCLFLSAGNSLYKIDASTGTIIATMTFAAAPNNFQIDIFGNLLVGVYTYGMYAAQADNMPTTLNEWTPISTQLNGISSYIPTPQVRSMFKLGRKRAYLYNYQNYFIVFQLTYGLE
ncbi:hypothetical protein [Paenibacillus sp. sgz500958]|uniref:hypothetical protein n=1 Tax=Paenibacillus sp. sgz500958 TaxID=3242475 RepID=UPI0036D429C1